MRIAQSCKAVRTVSILIPVYNERETIEQVMRWVATAPLPPGVEREVIVVDDGSSNGISQVLERYQGREPFRIVVSRTNSGKGAALCGASNVLYGSRITDEATAYKAFDAQFLQSLSLTCQRFEFCPDVTPRRFSNRGFPSPFSTAAGRPPRARKSAGATALRLCGC